MANYPYYRVGSWYFDTVAKVMYICTSAGYSTASGQTPVSVWSAVSGSGGSVNPYIFASDQGDYVLALAAGTGGITTTLSAGFTNGQTNVTSVTVASVAGIAVGQYITGTGIPSGIQVSAVNATTKVVTINAFTALAASSGNYVFYGFVQIAKPPKIRCSIASETLIDGTGVHTYQYNAITVGGIVVAYNRVDTIVSTSAAATEYITPPYLVGDTIYAVAIPTISMPLITGALYNFINVSLLDIHDKDWAL